MRRSLKWIICFIFIINTVFAHNKDSNTDTWFYFNDTHSPIINVDLFISSTCPHCSKADEYFKKLSSEQKSIKVNRYIIDKNKEDLKTFYEKLGLFNSTDFSVPTIIFCDSHWVGFSSSETTGKALLRSLNFCYSQILKEGSLSQSTINTIRQWSLLGKVSSLSEHDISPLKSIERLLITAIFEAFSPCSLFCFALFLAILWLYPNSRAKRFFIGALFILILGALHTTQFVFTPFYQQGFVYLSKIVWLIGILLLLFSFKIYKNFTTQDEEIPFLLTTIISVLAIIAVYAYQQSCFTSVAYLFQQWVSAASLTPAAFYLYQFVYLIFYLTPLTFLLLFYTLFGVYPVKIFSIAAFLIFVFLGLILTIYPYLLVNLLASIAAFLLVAGITFFLTRYKPKIL